MLPINPDRIPEIYRTARQLQDAGRIDAAADAYRQILSVKPDLAEAHFQLGRIALARREPREAAAHFARASKVRPAEAAIWQIYATAVNQIGDKAEADRLLAQAKAVRVPADLMLKLQETLGVGRARSKTSAGGAPPRDVQRAINAVQTGRFAEAERITAKLLKPHPTVSILHDIRAVALAALGRADQAEASWQRAMTLDPGYAEAPAKYGRFLQQKGETARAIPVLKKALAIAPAQPDALLGLGLAHETEGRFVEAIDWLERAVKSGGGTATDARLALARCHAGLSDHEAVAALLDTAENRASHDPNILNILSESLVSLGRDADARSLYEDAIAAHPTNAALLVGKAHVLQRLGDFDAANTLLRAAIALAPLEGDIYRIFFATHKVDPGDPIIAEMERIWAEEDLVPASRMALGFALARALEQIGAHDRVFAYLKPANDLVRAQQPYAIATRKREVARYIDAFAQANFDRSIDGATGFAPIFVTGLPRSGTTLIEQVLASHSRVEGGGELAYARRAVAGALLNADGSIRAVDDMPDAVFAEIGETVASRMQALFPSADRITDKSVLTYNLFGPTRLALPNASFVLVERDPRDTALSMYKNIFGAGRQLFSYDLADLGAYYQAYREIVAFWQKKLPGQIHVVAYERFLENPEVETRALLAHCGLEWEDACLEFHKNERRVDTVSLAQVRQPIYKTSMQAWRRYEEELAPLIEAIGDALPEEYRDGA